MSPLAHARCGPRVAVPLLITTLLLMDGEDDPVVPADPAYHQSFVYGNLLIEPDGGALTKHVLRETRKDSACLTPRLGNGKPVDQWSWDSQNETWPLLAERYVKLICGFCTGERSETSMTSSDSGVVMRISAGSLTNLRRWLSGTSPCHRNYLLLHNPTQCPLDLDPLEILFDDSSSTDLTFPLPTHVLQPGASVYIIESGATGTDIPTGANIMFSSSRGGAAILCNGPCNPSNGSNVVDVVAFSEGKPHGPLPSGVTFNPAGLSGINESTQSYLRINTQGTNPNFLAADWNLGPKSKP